MTLYFKFYLKIITLWKPSTFPISYFQKEMGNSLSHFNLCRFFNRNTVTFRSSGEVETTISCSSKQSIHAYSIHDFYLVVLATRTHTDF